MAVSTVKLSRRLLTTSCLLFAMAAPAIADTPAITPTVPGIVTPPTTPAAPNPDTPGVDAGSQAGQGALVSIMQAARPDYDAKGIHLGAFILNPIADLTENFSSNVYATTYNDKSDFYTLFSPLVTIQSGWNRDSVGATVGGDITRYVRYNSEDVDNFSASVNGRLDILDGMYANGSGGYQIEHEPRGSPNSVNGISPTEYHLASATLGYVKDNSVIGLNLGFSVNNYTYFNVPTTSGIPIIETDRDRTEYDINAKVSYELAPQYKAFIRASGNERAYDHKFDAGGYQRSSTGYEFDAGAALAIASKVDGEIYIGYLSQIFDDPRLSNAGGLGFGANLLWNVDGLTSVKASVARTVEETIVTQASSFVQTSVSVGIEHELLRNLLLSAAFNYANQDYQNFGRVDNVYGVNLMGKYLLNRYLATSLNIGYTKKTSNAIGISQLAEYEQALVAFKIHLQF